MKTIFLVTIAFIFAVQFIGCDKAPTEPPVTVNCNETEPLLSDTTGIWPLKPGNSWVYEIIKPEWIQDSLKMEITGSLIVCYNGQRYQVVKMSFHGLHETPPEYEWLYWSGPGGVYSMGGVSPTDTFVVKELELKYPAEVGDEWQNRIVSYSLDRKKFYISDTVTYSLTGKDISIETPAGNFKCFVYEFVKQPADDVLDKWHYKYYYYPEIGLTGNITTSEIEEGAIKEEFLLVK